MRLRKHVNNTDVAFEVLKCFYVREKDLYKLKVCWWNVGTRHAPWCMHLEQRLELTSAQLEDWKLYESPGNRVPAVPGTTVV